jgi:hypothetical protein
MESFDTASFGKALSGNPRFALCGLALIYAAEFLWIIFPQPQRLGERNALESRLTRPQIRYGHWGIADLTAFKLQWICPDRNIECARKVSVEGCAVWAGWTGARPQSVALGSDLGVSF